LPGQAFEIDSKGLWTAPDGTITRSRSSNLYIFTAVDLVSDYAYVACTPNCRGILKQHQKPKPVAFRRTGNRLCAFYLDTEFFKERV